ncbi:MAG: glycosyltransferase family 2 protein [Chromatiaceae bacterium]|nr:glycosyltransferase family 2 protein [Chromatiaceae bacterium]
MTVGVIIVNYFTEELLRPLVRSLVEFPMIREVIVFDNGNPYPLALGDGMPRVMGEGRNIGFAAAVNRAFTALSTDYVLLLNPDLRIDVAAVERLLTTSRRYRCPMVGPRFYWDDERLFRLPPATGALRWLGLGADAPSSLDGQLRGHYWALVHDHYWSQRSPFRQPFLPGACLLLDSNWVRRRGCVFDERYFMYYEDTDLCIEAQREGWMPLCIPGAEVVHYWDQSPEPDGGKERMMAEAGLALRHKFGLPEQDAVNTLPLLPQVPWVPPLNLGQITEAPQLGVKAFPAGTTFELAIEPGFVPFAQARLGPGGLTPDDKCFGVRNLVRLAKSRSWMGRASTISIPDKLWSRLRAGCYYARLRGPDGTVGNQWVWRRTP